MNSTAVRFRVVVANLVTSAVGDPAAFVAQGLPDTTKTGCRNEALRAGPGAFLPDRPAYEQTSPGEHGGAGRRLGPPGEDGRPRLGFRPGAGR